MKINLKLGMVLALGFAIFVLLLSFAKASAKPLPDRRTDHIVGIRVMPSDHGYWLFIEDPGSRQLRELGIWSSQETIKFIADVSPDQPMWVLEKVIGKFDAMYDYAEIHIRSADDIK